MSQRPDQTSTTAEVQVVELTMDNAEDQDELNRLLRKPGERERGSLPKNDHVGHTESMAEADRGRDQDS